jgi:virginiamycin B lyase
MKRARRSSWNPLTCCRAGLGRFWEGFREDVLDLVICEAPSRSRHSRWPVRLEIECLERRWLMSTGVITYGPVVGAPYQLTPPDRNGNLWATNWPFGVPWGAGSLNELTSSGTQANYCVTVCPYGENVFGVAVGADNNLWAITSFDEILKINPSPSGDHLNVLATYTLDPSIQSPDRIIAGPDGNLWFGSSKALNPSYTEVIGNISTNGAIRTYALSTSTAHQVGDITFGPDGNAWFTELQTGNIGRLGIKSSSDSSTWRLDYFHPSCSPTLGITTGPDGALWFGSSSKIGRITLTGSVSCFSLAPGEGSVNYITSAADGTLWFTTGDHSNYGSFGQISTAGVYQNVISPPSGHFGYGIEAGTGNFVWFTDPDGGYFCKLTWIGNAFAMTTDPEQGTRLPVGADSVDPATGNLRVLVPLDTSLGTATCGCDQPALVYNSNSVKPKPIVQVLLASNSDPNAAVPSSIEVTLTSDGVQQPKVTFPVSNHNPGDIYVMAVQAASPLTFTEIYGWSVTVDIKFASTGDDIPRQFMGQLPVVVGFNPQTSSSPYGLGWGLAGDDALLISNGAYWLRGAGGFRYFLPTTVTGTFAPPPDDFGSLVSITGGYLYTAEDQTQYSFTSPISGSTPPVYLLCPPSRNVCRSSGLNG